MDLGVHQRKGQTERQTGGKQKNTVQFIEHLLDARDVDPSSREPGGWHSHLGGALETHPHHPAWPSGPELGRQAARAFPSRVTGSVPRPSRMLAPLGGGVAVPLMSGPGPSSLGSMPPRARWPRWWTRVPGGPPQGLPLLSEPHMPYCKHTRRVIDSLRPLPPE